MSVPVKIVMIEDDEGHARLIERNIRRAGVNNEIVPFTPTAPTADRFPVSTMPTAVVRRTDRRC